MTESEIKQELFEQWLDHPVTRALMEKAARIQNNCRKVWENESWAIPVNELSSRLSTERLAYLRGKESAFRSLASIKWNELSWNDPCKEPDDAE